MPTNIGVYRDLRWSPYVQPPTSTLNPVGTVTPGRPTVSTHSGGGACGCGSSHGGASLVPVGVPLDAPGGSGGGASLKAPEGSGMNVFSSVDWPRDWWKFLAGAVAYRLLSK